MAELGDGSSPAVRGLRRERAALAALGRVVPGSSLAAYANLFGERTDWPEELRDTPVVLDIPMGGDPDGALTLAVAARRVPRLALVIAGEGTGSGRRARFARWLLDALGRPEVVVVEGVASGERRLPFDALVPGAGERQPADLVRAVRAVCAAAGGRPVRWVGLGPLHDLAHLLDRAPAVVPRLRLTQTAVAPRSPGGVEDGGDPDAEFGGLAGAVAAGRLAEPEIVTAAVAGASEIAVSPDGPVRRVLGAGRARWAAELAAHLDRWFEGSASPIAPHGVLALSAALDLPFVLSAPAGAVFDVAGQVERSAGEGVMLRLSVSARGAALSRWLVESLDPARSPARCAG